MQDAAERAFWCGFSSASKADLHAAVDEVGMTIPAITTSTTSVAAATMETATAMAMAPLVTVTRVLRMAMRMGTTATTAASTSAGDTRDMIGTTVRFTGNALTDTGSVGKSNGAFGRRSSSGAGPARSIPASRPAWSQNHCGRQSISTSFASRIPAVGWLSDVCRRFP